MGREERRRAERRARRGGPGTAGSPAAAKGAADGLVARSVLDELDRQKTAKPPVAAGVRADADAPARVRPPAARTERGAPAGPAAPVTTAASLHATSVGCDAVESADPQALGLTYTFEAPESGEPRSMTVRFTGTRSGVTGTPGPQDRFGVVETIDNVLPGSGRVTITTRVEGIATGEWTVRAGPADPPSASAQPMPATAQASGSTGFAPVVRVSAPGVRIGAWPALVGIGAVVALVVQTLLALRLSLPQPTVLLLSLVACLVGVVGARVYYVVEHPNRRRGWMNATSGVCIQGFVLGAVGTVVAGALVLGLPVGGLLDVTTPGLLFGMAIGRIGCFLGGCCAGRPTGASWGLWSSDRRLGARRVPTQLFESSYALVVGLVALLVVLTAEPDPAGVVFVAAIAAYTLGRQLLFPLRNLARNTTHGRTITLVLSALVLITAVAVSWLT